MEALSQLGTSELPAIIVPTINSFYNLLEKNSDAILGTKKKSFSYGSVDRQQLDVYYPPTGSDSGKNPILIWVYGGGFTTGSRNYPAPFALGWANLGSYFARRGFITVIPDYRLVPSVTYPQPAEDVRDAALWVANNPESLTDPSAGVYPDLNEIHVMGHSAGGAHVLTALLLDTPESAELRSKIAAVITCAAMYHSRSPIFKEGTMMHSAYVQHYGSAEKARENDPMALFSQASDGVIESFPRSLLFLGENEPDWAKELHADYERVLRERLSPGKVGPVIVGEGHNHLSYNWALGSGEGEKWAEDIIQWIKGASPG